MERPSFDKDYILNELDRISVKMAFPVNLFVIGGLALIHFGLKEATKDIDVVTQSRTELDILTDALKSLEYRSPRHVEISRAYEAMEASEILENKQGFRWDIFFGRICHALSFSAEMKTRANLFYENRHLRVAFASKEDIFLFKGITEREADLDDMRLLAESGLDWKVIEQECHNQSISSGRLWENALFQKLVDLREKHKIRSPIERTLRRITEERLAKDAIIQAVKTGKITIQAVAKSEELPSYVIRATAEQLEKEGVLKIDRTKRPFTLSLMN
ncbi:MAG TPA: DUF6036 family nucleotidyltransferase [Candidatus Bathyarchaeia archaeon]|nr:DUF6036 family nucleotidyltransferase [Candidatus Bathyarchaeia archaeon]